MEHELNFSRNWMWSFGRCPTNWGEGEGHPVGQGRPRVLVVFGIWWPPQKLIFIVPTTKTYFYCANHKNLSKEHHWELCWMINSFLIVILVIHMILMTIIYKAKSASSQCRNFSELCLMSSIMYRSIMQYHDHHHHHQIVWGQECLTHTCWKNK